MARILVVEASDCARVAAVFGAQGFTVATTEYGDAALLAIERLSPSLILLEIIRADRPAVRLCEHVRGLTQVPIVVVSRECGERDVIAMFGVGVDSFIPESTGAHELVARVRALLRRAPRVQVTEADVLRVGPVVIDGSSRELRVGGALVRVPRREFDIAQLLMRKAGRVVTRDELIRELWGTHRDTKSLDVQVGRLRNRLANAEGRRRIVTVRGVGYRFLADTELEDEADVVIELRGGDDEPISATIHLGTRADDDKPVEFERGRTPAGPSDTRAAAVNLR